MTDFDSADNSILIDQYIENDEKEKALDLIYKLALQSAKHRNFVNAEAYRDRLYEVDSMALSKIVDVNELIETEKRRALTPDLRRMWGPFFRGLTSEEVGSFFLALKEKKIDSDQIVLRQGEPNDRLYLVHNGNLKVVYREKEKEMLIQRVGSGDIFGQDTFFSLNVCTTTVKTLSPVRVSYLERETLANLSNAMESLESNLEKVCCSGASLFERMRMRGIDRRSYRRFNLQSKVSVQLLSSGADDHMRRPMTAELWDVSKTGLSFYFKSKNRDAVRRLVGRTLGISFTVLVGDQLKEVNVTGVVQGVASHPVEEYSVHLKLNRNFSDRSIQIIQSSAAPQDNLR